MSLAALKEIIWLLKFSIILLAFILGGMITGIVTLYGYV